MLQIRVFEIKIPPVDRLIRSSFVTLGPFEYFWPLLVFIPFKHSVAQCRNIIFMGKSIKIPSAAERWSRAAEKAATQESNENKWLNKRTIRVLQVDYGVGKKQRESERKWGKTEKKKNRIHVLNCFENVDFSSAESMPYLSSAVLINVVKCK